MSRSLSSKALREFAEGVDCGDITDDIIHRLRADPHIVYRGAPRVKEDESRIGVVPKGFILSSQPSYQNPQLVGHSALYVAEALGRSGYYVVCGDSFSRQFVFFPQALCVAQGKPAYFVREKVGGSSTRFVWGQEERLLLSDVSSLSLTDDGMPLLVVHDHSAGCRIDSGDKILAQSANLIHHPIVSRGVLAYVEQHASRQWVVVNGVPGQQFETDESVEQLLLWGKEPIAVIFSEKRRVHEITQNGVRGKPYHLIGNVSVDENSLLLYDAKETVESPWIIVYGNREIYRPDWQGVYSPKAMDGQILFTVRVAGVGEMVATWKDDIITYGHSYQSIDACAVTFVDGSAFYPASRGDGKWFVVWRDGEGKSYDQIFSPHVEGDTIVYGARNGREFFRVTRPITPRVVREEKSTGSLESVI